MGQALGRGAESHNKSEVLSQGRAIVKCTLF